VPGVSPKIPSRKGRLGTVPTAPRSYCSAPRCPNRRPCPIHRPRPSSEQVRLRGYSGVKRRRIKLARDPICENCGKALAEEVDHTVPLGQGGTEDWSNLAALCKDCHKTKTAQERKRDS
jgi:5-methylcytosine-specific restriction protein A